MPREQLSLQQTLSVFVSRQTAVTSFSRMIPHRIPCGWDSINPVYPVYYFGSSVFAAHRLCRTSHVISPSRPKTCASLITLEIWGAHKQKKCAIHRPVHMQAIINRPEPSHPPRIESTADGPRSKDYRLSILTCAFYITICNACSIPFASVWLPKHDPKSL